MIATDFIQFVASYTIFLISFSQVCCYHDSTNFNLLGIGRKWTANDSIPQLKLKLFGLMGWHPPGPFEFRVSDKLKQHQKMKPYLSYNFVVLMIKQVQVCLRNYQNPH